MYTYDSKFFAATDRSAAASADAIIDLLIRVLPVKSVLDLGCGRGLWPARWLARGIQDVVGVDGPYVDAEELHIRHGSPLVGGSTWCRAWKWRSTWMQMWPTSLSTI
jgi:SAM-dependent methyltransferase